MDVKMRNDLTPQGLIRHLFAETQNGEFTVEYENFYNSLEKEQRTFTVNWTAEDVEKTVERYNVLTFALARIGRLHDQLEEEESRKNLLSEGDLAVYNTYVRPYEPMEVNWDALGIEPAVTPEELPSLIEGIRERGRYGDLFPEEELLWEQYCKWNEEQSQKRIPFHRRSCAQLITRAKRFERLIHLGAPEVVVTDEGRCLAEEMILYYFGKEEPIVWE